MLTGMIRFVYACMYVLLLGTSQGRDAIIIRLHEFARARGVTECYGIQKIIPGRCIHNYLLLTNSEKQVSKRSLHVRTHTQLTYSNVTMYRSALHYYTVNNPAMSQSHQKIIGHETGALL